MLREVAKHSTVETISICEIDEVKCELCTCLPVMWLVLCHGIDNGLRQWETLKGWDKDRACGSFGRGGWVEVTQARITYRRENFDRLDFHR